jgi:tRNA threonylcarbamoyladenosine biosynthesis protein TsaB
VKLLAIETSTEACSVALYVDGEVAERHELAPRRHTQLVLPWADELLAQAGLKKSQLDAIAVGRGPGAFTGVRLAVALVQGLALALDRPVLPVSTLAILAMQGRGARIMAAIDARMGEVYFGYFLRDAEGLVTPDGDERVLKPAEVPTGAGPFDGVGTGFGADNGALRQRLAGALQFVDDLALPRASDLLQLARRDFLAGRAISADAIEPAYLRDKVALTLREQGKA